MKRYASGGLLVFVLLAVAISGATAGSGSALSVYSVTAAPKPKPLPTPKRTLSVTQGLHGVVIKGGFKLQKTNLPTYYRVTEQEFDASNNSLPLSTSGYQLVQDPATKAWKALTTASKTGRATLLNLVMPQRIPGAYKITGTVTISVPATKTHKRASATRPFSFQLGGFTAVGTTVPTMISSYVPGGGSACEWDRTFNVVDGSPTFQLPQQFVCHTEPTSSGAQCGLKGMPAGPPTDIVPPGNRGNGVSDPPAPQTGLTDYGIEADCPDGSVSIPQLWVRFGYPAGDTCELPLAGVTSFTIPPPWGGSTTVWATLMSFRDAAHTQPFYTTADMLNAPSFESRNPNGTVDACSAYHLPPQNVSSISG